MLLAGSVIYNPSEIQDPSRPGINDIGTRPLTYFRQISTKVQGKCLHLRLVPAMFVCMWNGWNAQHQADSIGEWMEAIMEENNTSKAISIKG